MLVFQLTLCSSVLSNKAETHLLFTYGPGDRESVGRAETSYGVSPVMCGDGGAEGEGEQLLRDWVDESKELVYSP